MTLICCATGCTASVVQQVVQQIEVVEFVLL